MADTRLEQPKAANEVGFSRLPNKKTLGYGNVVFDDQGWADAKIVSPVRGDLCRLIRADRGETHGWWTGATWFGPRIKKTDRILKWKLFEEDPNEKNYTQLDLYE